MLFAVELPIFGISRVELAGANSLLAVLDSDVGGKAFTLWKILSRNLVIKVIPSSPFEHRDGFV